MTDDYAELRAALPDATPGPWPVRHRSAGRGPGDDESGGLGWECGYAWDDPRADENAGPPEPILRGLFARWADARYIAAANPSVIAALLADRDRLAEAALAVVQSYQGVATGSVAGPEPGPDDFRWQVSRDAIEGLRAVLRGSGAAEEAGRG